MKGIVKALTHEVETQLKDVPRGDLMQAATFGHNAVHSMVLEIVCKQSDGVLGLIVASGRKNTDLIPLYGGTGQMRNYSNNGRNYRQMLREMATDVLLDHLVAHLIETEGEVTVRL